jgi:hypothetical protein
MTPVSRQVVIETGTVCRLSVRFCAVTTISGIWSVSVASANAACPQRIHGTAAHQATCCRARPYKVVRTGAMVVSSLQEHLLGKAELVVRHAR